MGLGSIEPHFFPIPQKIANLNNIVKIKCGINHCLAIDKSGSLFSWGSGKGGELGNQQLKDQPQP